MDRRAWVWVRVLQPLHMIIIFFGMHHNRRRHRTLHHCRSQHRHHHHHQLRHRRRRRRYRRHHHHHRGVGWDGMGWGWDGNGMVCFYLHKSSCDIAILSFAWLMAWHRNATAVNRIVFIIVVVTFLCCPRGAAPIMSHPYVHRHAIHEILANNLPTICPSPCDGGSG